MFVVKLFGGRKVVLKKWGESGRFESGGRVVVLMQKLATLRSKRTAAEIGPFIVKKRNHYSENANGIMKTMQGKGK